MFDFLNKLMPFIRIVFPEQRRWLVRVFVGAGIAAALGPFWEPYVIAVMKRYLDVQVPAGAPQVTGWALLIIGLCIHVRNEYVDHRPKPIVVSHEDRTDRKGLTALFSEIHISSIDTFVEFGKSSITYLPALHFFAGVDACVSASDFHLHDSVLKKQVDDFHASLGKALSYGEFFDEMPNRDLMKFASRHDVHQDERAKSAHDGFLQSVYETEKNLRALCGTVRRKFPDFDFSATNAAALKDYRDTQQAFKI